MKFYVWGVLAMASLVPALFFLRYWRSSRERLFAFFAVAFGLMALQWTLSSLTGTDEADHSYVLLLRILAFVAIIVGVLDKNRRERRP
ncbi:MAG TPA: DUF5985 family protein [Steroidobacteraceae bacterium]|jgi:hypothetical protein|nr:DUF5985 family protein [Steroidobacteraceae bacterium]